MTDLHDLTGDADGILSDPAAAWMAGPPPHDLRAERQVLGAMLWGPESVEAVCETITHEDFYRPAHSVIFKTIIIMHAAGMAVDCLTVREYIERAGEVRALGGVERAAGYLLDLYSGLDIPGPARALAAARIVWDRSVKRKAQESLTHALQTVAMDGETLELLARAVDEIEDAAAYADESSDPLSGPLRAGEFSTRAKVTARRVVIEGLLTAGDRCVIVAPEGGGKSTLGRQVAGCGAAGVHPFTYKPVPPCRALILDFENPHDYLADGLDQILTVARYCKGWDEDRLHVWSHRRHLDVRNPADAFRIIKVIRATRPDLVVAGPVWKMIRPGREGPEAAAWELTGFFDRLIERFGFALWLETHPPTGMGNRREMRPKGGEVWQAWPDYGLSLVPSTAKTEPEGALRVEKFRGHRVLGRDWPNMLHRAESAGQWPWVSRFPEGTFR